MINGWLRLSHARDSGEGDPQCHDIGPFSEFWVESKGNATGHSIFPSADRAARFTSLRQMGYVTLGALAFLSFASSVRRPLVDGAELKRGGI